MSLCSLPRTPSFPICPNRLCLSQCRYRNAGIQLCLIRNLRQKASTDCSNNPQVALLAELVMSLALYLPPVDLTLEAQFPDLDSEDKSKRKAARLGLHVIYNISLHNTPILYVLRCVVLCCVVLCCVVYYMFTFARRTRGSKPPTGCNPCKEG